MEKPSFLNHPLPYTVIFYDWENQVVYSTLYSNNLSFCFVALSSLFSYASISHEDDGKFAYFFLAIEFLVYMWAPA